MRTAAIWICGILGSAMVGGILGNMTDGFQEDGGSFFGTLAGALLFVCVRLWMAERKPPLPVLDLKGDRLQ